MTIDQRMDRLTGIVEALAASVVARDNQIDAHDRQIDALITIAEKSEKRLAMLERQLEAYLKRLPPQ
jgi:uncharacterized protein (DUF3084 family)